VTVRISQPMTDVHRYTLAPGVVFTPTGDEALLLNLNRETMFVLNSTGARTVQLVIDGMDLETVIRTLASQYSAEATAVEADTKHLIDRLLAGGLLQRRDVEGLP
jgi:hypothetical protein